MKTSEKRQKGSYVPQWLKGRRVGVLMGGWSPERVISLRTGRTVLAALKRLGIAARGIDVDRTLPQRLQRHRIDIAFLALHGPGGEDGSVQGMLEVLEIPYTGSGVAASAVALHKGLTKQIFQAAGLPTPAGLVIARGNRTHPETMLGKRSLGGRAEARKASDGILDDGTVCRASLTPPQAALPRLQPEEGFGMSSRIPHPTRRWPVVVKPTMQGSALGVTIARTPAEFQRGLRRAWRLSPSALVEAYIRGTEVTVGILGDQPLPVIEIIPANPFYDYEAKYVPGKSTHVIPARLPAGVLHRVQMLALAAFRALGAKAVARVDMIVDRRMEPFLLEVNTIPGMTETSLLPEAARAIGISFDELVLKILKYSLDA
ncbi:MAG: D-alanine--D-alanine ligase [Elusimicrobia bacterium]|nr:D-alanine--D-alanine ligase [Elusimicrobiota bacterium]